MKKITKIFAVILLVSASTISSANIITLDFNDQPIGNCVFVGTSFTSQGVNFTKTGNTSGFFACSNPFALANNPSSNVMIDANNRSQFDMTMLGGSAFDLLSFDAGARFGDASSGIRLTGTQLGGSTLTTDLIFNGTDWDNFGLSGFTNLASVSWLALGTGRQFAFDNITIDNQPSSVSVPEPSILALLSLGLAGIGFSKKKKTHQ